MCLTLSENVALFCTFFFKNLTFHTVMAQQTQIQTHNHTQNPDIKPIKTP